MKIDEIYRNLTIVQNSPGSQNVQQARSEIANSQGVRKPTDQDAKVEISDVSIALNTVKEILDKEDPERVAKVQALKEAIIQGKYEVNAESIADKMLKDSLANLVED